MRYALLLRGVNVGKSVKVSMTSLKSMLEDIGFENVMSYLNSGNVLFDSNLPKKEIALVVENKLHDFIGQKIPILIKSASELKKISSAIPGKWQNDEFQKTDIAYLFAEADNKNILDNLPIKREYVDIRYVKGALLWNVQRENYNRSQLNNIIGHKIYSKMTVRNVNTARRLAELATCKSE